ncbi:hypothetical protein FB451DRAFT_1556036, partial [Mycena latifolia]
MADPITVATTLITLATFIKDLIEVGQSIKRSLEKVGENRRRIREMTEDMLRTLADLANLARRHEDPLHAIAPELLCALENLKADMLYVLSRCRRIAPDRPSPGIKGVKSQIKAWLRREYIEGEIRRLKKHINRCFLQFTAFSAARIEYTSLRIEQTLVVANVENQVRLQRLEGMMARVLLDTQFGHNSINRTAKIIKSDTAHQTLEFQYLSTETLRLIESLHLLAANNLLVVNEPLWDCKSVGFVKFLSAKQVLRKILGLLLKVKDSPTGISFTSIEGVLQLGSHLAYLGMNSEAAAWHLMTLQTLRRFSGGGLHILPTLALSSHNLARVYQYQLRWDIATETSQQ